MKLETCQNLNVLGFVDPEILIFSATIISNERTIVVYWGTRWRSGRTTRLPHESSRVQIS